MKTGKSSRLKVSGSKLLSFIIGLAMFEVLLLSCNSGAKQTVPTEKIIESGTAKFVVSEELHNFGSLKAGEIVSYTFVFRNEGTKNLIITGVETGCGCTGVKIPNKPIEPGNEGTIEVIFNSAGKFGQQLHTITLFSNSDKPEKQIFIKANITNELIEIYS